MTVCSELKQVIETRVKRYPLLITINDRLCGTIGALVRRRTAWQAIRGIQRRKFTRMRRSDSNLHPVADPACWYPGQFYKSTTWKFQLSEGDLDTLLTMARMVRVQIDDNPDALLTLTRVNFPLGPFKQTISRIYSELQCGSGVALITGLPINDMALIEAAIIYWAIGRHLGTACPNNPEGDYFGHITDLGKTQSDANSRGYQTREAMDYHCDQCDIVGLLCIRNAKQGGISKLASSIAMYNTLLQKNPELIEVLSNTFYWTKHGEHLPNELPYYRSRVFNFLNGKLCTSFGPKHILKGHAIEGTPELTEVQRRAIRKAEETADELHIEMVLKPGDMQFINNYVSVHTRSAYIDYEDVNQKRLLWRLWLMNDSLRSRTDYAKQWARGVTAANSRAQIRLL